MLRQRFYIIGFALTILFAITACAHKEPISDLSQGQEGKIFFSSANSPTFKNILVGGGPSEPATIFGALNMPKKASGKVPAAVILHGSAGVKDYHFQAAHDLNDIGIATFVIDSQKPRGIWGSKDAVKNLAYSMRVADAYAALKMLSTHPGIDKERVAIIGFSRGGDVAVFASSEKIRRSLSSRGLRFAATVVYCPTFLAQFKNIEFTGAPILMLFGEKDNIGPVQINTDYAQRINSSGTDVKVVVYKGAHHAFYNPNVSGRVITIETVADYSKCQHKYSLLQDDGTWYIPYLKKTVDKLTNLLEFLDDCKIDGQGTIGDPTEVRTESIKECHAFLKRAFNLP